MMEPMRAIPLLCLSCLTGWLLVCGAASPSAAQDSACEEIQQACGRAGFTRDVPGGKDLDQKCYQPLMHGETVKGVAVEPSLVKKCTAENTAPKPKPTGKRKSHPLEGA